MQYDVVIVGAGTSGLSTASTLSICAEPPVFGAGSKEVGLIVTHLFLSLLFTVAKALPA